jgi:hypothetical protein
MKKYTQTLLQDISVDVDSLKKFGVLMMAVFFVLMFFATSDGNKTLQITWFLLFFVFAWATVYERFLRMPFLIWMFIAKVIGSVVERILLIIIFCFIFVPGGLVLRILRRDILHRKIDHEAKTYWTDANALEETTYELPY